MEEMALEFIDVSTKGKKFSLQNVSFSLPKGYVMGLSGRNGAGKTTLLKLIVEEGAKYSGKIKIFGKELKEERSLMNQIAWICEDVTWLLERNAVKNATLLGVFYETFDMQKFLDKMQEFGVSVRQNVGTYSKGEFVKFQLAFGIAHGAKLFLLDEATAGMDVVFRREFWKQIGKWIAQEEITVVAATHIEQELELKTDYIGIMEEGRMISYGENAAV
ncbi:MAG: ABC transporter ATP-binding protein [Lachnospiraceae bacterium]|nr:ABC transporter ATP-binding protein [Lachnospiraceae bacterium]